MLKLISVLLVCAMAVGCASEPASGAAGDQGLQGATGPMGPQGPQGQVGPMGPKGDEGKQGPVGPQGDRGGDGRDGAQGPAGPQGPVGPIGPAGPAGPQGLKGDSGNGLAKGGIYMMETYATASGAGSSAVMATAKCKDVNDVVVTGYCGAFPVGTTLNVKQFGPTDMTDATKVSGWQCVADPGTSVLQVKVYCLTVP